jgi:hypothetical protein
MPMIIMDSSNSYSFTEVYYNQFIDIRGAFKYCALAFLETHG